MGLHGWESGSELYLDWVCQRRNASFPLSAINHDKEKVGYIEKCGLWNQIRGFRMSPGCLEQVLRKQKILKVGGGQTEITRWEKKGKDWCAISDISEASRRIGWKDIELGHFSLERVGAHMHWCWYQEGFGISKEDIAQIRQKQKELSHDRKAAR